VDVVVGNEAEFAALSDDGDAERLATTFGRRGMLAVVTMGRRGALAHGPEGRQVIGTEEVPAGSALGAGDAFAGAFLFGLFAGLPSAICLSRGISAANAVLQVHEARTPLFGQKSSGMPD
jgi:sugar/nucleoside kinase (ribokinase family)